MQQQQQQQHQRGNGHSHVDKEIICMTDWLAEVNRVFSQCKSQSIRRNGITAILISYQVSNIEKAIFGNHR